jgi:hypothetical protein
MTYTVPLHNTLSKEGIDLTATYTIYDQTAAQSATNSPDTPAPPFVIGETCESSNGGEFMFVKAASAIAQYDFVGISTNYNAASLSTSTTGAGPIVAVAQVAIASGSCGWVCLRGGGVSGNVLLSCATSAVLYATTVPGSLDDAAFSSLQPKVEGVVCTTARGTTNGSTAVLLSYPLIEL